MLERDAKYYKTGYDGEDLEKAPFYLNSLVFDGAEGDYNAHLIESFNSFVRKERFFSDACIVRPDGDSRVPDRVLVINASHDDLPTSHETARIIRDYLDERGMKADVEVVDTHDALMSAAAADPGRVLILSQCVDKKVYNVDIAGELEKKGAVIVPGKITAPGSVFSDKDSTYRLLSGNGANWDEVARYIKVDPDGKSTGEVVEGILGAVERLSQETGEKKFFVKPHEGGGGLGGFRITRSGEGYVIPDLSKVTGDASVIHPMYIDIDTADTARLNELLWIYRLFASDEKTRKSYLTLDLGLERLGDEEAVKVLRAYIDGSGEKRQRKFFGMVMAREEARDRLTGAIDIFEKKFQRRYIPLVNQHIDFGFWGLRAHYRLSRSGPVLETMYSRIFQLAFTEEGVGYVGADNISNKQTGELEIIRLGPIRKIMVDSVGGEEVLFRTLIKGARALVILAGLLDEEERKRDPVRVQLDLAVLSERIGEGNADTARGMCLASRWPMFVKNTREWFEDSLAYYSWKKGRGGRSLDRTGEGS